ncbi:MAG: IS66 family transposase [Dehalococcoidia bacterium]
MSDEELANLSRADLETALRRALARIGELEQQLGQGRVPTPPVKTPENSSVPPAKGWKRARPGGDGTTPSRGGAKHGHAGKSRLRKAIPDLQFECRPTTCGGCGAALPVQGGKRISRRQMTELVPLQPVVIEARRVRVRCPTCQQTTAGQYPEGFGQVGSFGPRLLALVGLLHEEQHIAYGRLVGLLQTLFGLQISEGALVAAVQRLGTVLAPAAKTIGEAVRDAPVVGSDETSARVGGATWWEWVFQTPAAAYHTIQRRRNRAVVEDFLEEAEPEVWVSDLWGPQLGAPTDAYQICLAHQLRDLQYAQEWETAAKQALERAWAERLAALLRRAIQTRHEEQAGRLAASAFVAAVTAIEQECAALLAEALRPGASAKLQRRYCAHRAGLLTFLARADVPPTNNASEQSLRPSVIHRQVLGAFRSDDGPTTDAIFRTVADTARKRSEDLFKQLHAALVPFQLLTAHYAFASSNR